MSVPATIERVVAIGPGALRLYIYAGTVDKIVGIEQFEVGETFDRPYMMAYPSLADLPVIGQGGPNNTPDPEKLLNAAPDVIFSTYVMDASAVDELQAKTGIPVVVISYGHTFGGATNLFEQAVSDSLLLIGKVIDNNTKAQAVVDYIRQVLEDLGKRTSDIPDADKPSVYVGGLRASGSHGIESTQGNYSLLIAIHAKNVVDKTGESGYMMIDKEKLLTWNPDFIFIDLGGLSPVVQDYQKNPVFYKSLSAVQNGKIYAQLPYTSYNTNIDTAIADAYYLGTILYPAAFADINPEQKADEIYQALLGHPVYAQMAEACGGFGPLNLSDQ